MSINPTIIDYLCLLVILMAGIINMIGLRYSLDYFELMAFPLRIFKKTVSFESLFDRYTLYVLSILMTLYLISGFFVAIQDNHLEGQIQIVMMLYVISSVGNVVSNIPYAIRNLSFMVRPSCLGWMIAYVTFYDIIKDI